jgi:hypothetical protein
MFFKSLDSSFGQLNNKGGTLMELAISYCGAPGGSRTHDLASEAEKIDVHKHQLIDSNLYKYR